MRSPTTSAPPRTSSLPRPLPGLVARPRLVRTLLDATAPLIAVRAPAGYGKSVLLRQWEQEDPRPFAWIDRGGRCDDAGGLMGAIAEQLDAARGARVLVLDDPRVLRDASGLALLADVAAWQPDGSHVVVATRGEPALPLGLLRVEGGLLELGASDLAMTDLEAEQLLEAAGVATDPAALERCEGWPAGLRLAALALGATAGADRSGTRFDGADGFVADYLSDTLLAAFDPADVAFLRRCSLLGELSGPLCDAVLQRRESGELLRSLARGGVPLTPLDRGERRFRPHPLLAQMLRAQLRRREPELVPALHARAAVFHMREHDVPRALDHALGVDSARAGELLWSLAPAYAAAGRGRELAAWIARCDDDRLAADPALALSAAVERLAAGDRDATERWADAAERALGARAVDATDRPLRGGLALVRAGLGRGNARRLSADAANARELAAADDPAHVVAELLEGAALRLLGETEQAQARIERAARRQAVALPLVRACGLALRAMTELEAGDRAEALRLASTAVDELEAGGLADDPHGAFAYAVAACMRADAPVAPPTTSGRPDAVVQARADADRAQRLLAALPDPAPWFAAETRLALAHALLRLSDAAAARVQLQRAGRLLRVLHDASGLRARLDAAWECADSFAIGAVSGPAALTIAELRVLRFLPSHLSFREIGARLHVSANTVKTQAHAVYRKLDASSRSEAVARATQIGLVGG
ncbi:LuxR C-terminal-related transcriptional regulator [Conexibacter sp. CPCC 206217]|uniref:LuxR C-terminal-related transcriptional regulator n=1 Tax=Conexibacter sp. CPCC 206217 TaxID=3064574 RepID=UPI00271823ED|nr:LuxR C-terminal-related transcriptional regulator [Conexibacter sp. CPCC 206217]MDO8214207.1 LuxR C-terminal-related transcriptional regulator [Conexibacter sp. CPCC 206217]